MCAANILPVPFTDDPAPTFKQDIMNHVKNATMTFLSESSSARDVLTAIKKLQNNAVIMLAMCGHGSVAPVHTQSSSATTHQSGVLLLAGGDRLTEGAIASALGGFKGTLIMAYCMRHASSLQPVAASSLMCGEVTVDRPTNDSIHNLAKTCRRIVKVFSCDRSETIKPAQALTFSRLLGRMIRDRPLYKELQEWVEKTWAECRTITQEPPSMWRPAPIVSVYTSPATLARQDHEQERFME